MRLHKAVELRNLLSSLSVEETSEELKKLDSKIMIGLNISGDMSPDTFTPLLTSLSDASRTLSSIQENITEVIAAIDNNITEMTKEYLSRGYVINGVQPCMSTSIEDERRLRVLPVSDELRPIISAKIKRYTDWHYPALEIGPGDGYWTADLVAADPLYIADQRDEYLTTTMKQFNIVYQNRIRRYLIKIAQTVDSVEDTDLSELPQGQFGFIFSWNVFNYFPLSHVKAYLEQCFSLLRPGGVVMFSYNNAENVRCAEYVETGFRSWMPSSLLVKTCNDIGFTVLNQDSYTDDIHTIEIAKPGQLTSIKAHQALGEIMPRIS